MSAVLQANERKEFRKSYLRKLREEGQIPAVIYGRKVGNQTVYLNAGDLIKTIREVGRNGVISLEVDGKKHDVVLTDYQEDSLKNQIIHADFLAVDMSTEINANVRIALIGEAAGEKEGGVTQQALHELSVKATPNEIPSVIEVDISDLQIGDSLAVKDIAKSDQKYEILHDEDETIVSVLPPRVEEEQDEDAVEPEAETVEGGDKEANEE